MSHTLRRARRIMAVLAPMTGSRATATLTVRSSSGTPTLSKGATCVPVRDGSVHYEQPFFVPSDVTLSTAGVSVPIVSVIGGARHNGLVVGDEVRWLPSEGDVASAVVATPSSGATNGEVKQLVMLDQLTADVSAQLFAARVGTFPAMVLGWESTNRYESKGNGAAIRPDNWKLYVVVARTDGHEVRSAEGTRLLDRAEELLLDRVDIDGLQLSNPSLEINGRGRVAVSPTSFVYTLSFSTWRGVRRDDSIKAAKAVPWTTTNIDATTGLEGQAADKTIVDDLKVDMTP